MPTIWDTLRSKDSTALSALIASGVDVNEEGAVRADLCRTPPRLTHCTARTDQPTLPEFLRSWRARISQGEQTPLHLASELDAKDCVTVLLAAKAKTEAEDGQLRTALSLACESKAFESAQILVTGGASLASRDKSDMTPLHWMANFGQAAGAMALLRLAVAKGGDIDATNYQMQTPLHFAITRGNIACALALVDAGASLAVKDETAGTMMHLAMQYAGSLGEAAESLELLQRLLKAPTGKVCVRVRACALCACACACACTDVRACVASWRPRVLTPARAPERPRRIACRHRHRCRCRCRHRSLTVLLLHTCLQAMVTSRDREKRTPLHWAAGKNALPCVSALLQAGADVHACDWAEHTPLHWACLTDAVESVKALEAAGAKTDVADRDKRTPLHWAAERGAEEVLKHLVNTSKVGLDAVDAGGFTALHSAARRGMADSCKLLLAKGANANVAAFNGDTAMDLASGADVRKVLAPAGGSSPAMKRKRTMSSGKLDLAGSPPASFPYLHLPLPFRPLPSPSIPFHPL